MDAAEKLIKLAGIHGDYSHPTELWEQISIELPNISKEEYMRVVELLQKARFGGIELESYEYRTLECFRKSLCRGLYKKKGRTGRLVLRYVWAIPICSED